MTQFGFLLVVIHLCFCGSLFALESAMNLNDRPSFDPSRIDEQEFHRQNIVRRLIPLGLNYWANPNEPTLEQRQELRAAVLRDDRKRVRELIAEGLLPNTHDGSDLRRMPLHYAKSQRMVRLLIRRGAHMNAKDGDGRTPLHLHALRFNNRVVKELLDHGADTNFIDLDGHAPLCYTTEQCPESIRSRLVTTHVCTREEGPDNLGPFLAMMENYVPGRRSPPPPYEAEWANGREAPGN